MCRVQYAPVQGAHRTSSNLLYLHPYRDSKVFRFLLHEFGVVRLDRTFSDYIFTGDRRSAGCNMHRFGEVQAHRTSSNLFKLHPHRDSKVYRLLSHEFGVVRLNRTFSDCIFTGDRRSEGAICTSWMRLKHIDPHRTFSNYILKHFEPHRTFSNYILTEIARYIDFFHTTTSSQREEGI